MSMKFVWTGLEELKAELKRLPDECHAEVFHFAEARGNQAALAIRQRYHIGRTGHLVEGVVVEPLPESPFYTGVRVSSKSNIGFIYERGTEKRTSRYGNRGISPPHPVFVEEMERHRALFFDDEADLLRRKGFTVTRA